MRVRDSFHVAFDAWAKRLLFPIAMSFGFCKGKNGGSVAMKLFITRT